MVQTVSAATLYIDGSWGHNGWDGLTNQWLLGTSQGPLQNISAGISAASSGDVMVVAAGFYQETNWHPGAKSLTIVPTGSVTIYDTDPWQTDSDGDGLPDAWEAAYNLDAFSTNGVNGAAGDADSDSVSNIEEYLNGSNPLNADNTPPVITVAPVPNEAGWFRTNVVVTFSAVDAVDGALAVTVVGQTSYSSETNDAEVVGYVRDAAGNLATEYVYVNLDKTPPTITLDPGNGEQFDNSHPLLIVDYADSGTGVPPVSVSSALDLATLSITLNGNDVTTNFYRFDSRALLATNLPAGTHTWSANIADLAGNVTTVSNTFVATGAINTNAPVLSELEWAEQGLVVLPDLAELWVQGTVSGSGSVVSASVNGGEAAPMNRRGEIFGYLLALEPGTNVIVVVGSDVNTNQAAKVLVVERSEKYQAAITNVVFGAFANGVGQKIAGLVSLEKYAGTPAATVLTGATVTVGGVSYPVTVTDLGGGMGAYSTDAVVPAPCDAVTMILELAWADGSEVEIPLGLWEGYEIEYRNTTHEEYYSDMLWPIQTFAEYYGVALPCESNYSNRWGGSAWHYRTTETFQFSCSPTNNVVWNFEDSTYTNSSGFFYGCGPGCQGVCADVTDPIVLDLTTSLGVTNGAPQPSRVWSYDDTEAYGPYTLWYFPEDSQGYAYYRSIVTNSVLVFRAPLHYPPNTPVIFTLEGVYCTDALSNLTLWGQSPVAVSNEAATVSYLLEMTGGDTYTINKAAFNWASSSPASWCTNYPPISEYPDLMNISNACSTVTIRRLRFTGFHNAAVGILRPFGSAAGRVSTAFPLVGNLSAAWLTSPCFHWDFQGLDAAYPYGNYRIDIFGVAELPVFSWKLELAADVGTLSSTTVFNPTHNPPSGLAAVKEGTLSLWDDPASAKRIRIYRDHMERDMENFGSIQSCKGGRWDTPYGSVKIDFDYNCHDSVRHAINGTFDYGVYPAALLAATRQAPLIFSNSVYTAAATNAVNDLNRGDVVVFYLRNCSGMFCGVNYELQHSATAIGTAGKVWGANNANLAPNRDETWHFGIRSVFEILDDYKLRYSCCELEFRIHKKP